MTLFVILCIGGIVGLLTGAILRRLGGLTRIFDTTLGLLGAFVGGAMGTSALLEGLSHVALAMAAGAAAALVLLAHIGSALIRPVHGKYFRR